MLATAILASAVQSYVIVGVLTCLLLPRSRALLMSAMRSADWRSVPRLAHLGFCVSAAALTSVAWPLVLKSAYLQPQPQRVSRSRRVG